MAAMTSGPCRGGGWRPAARAVLLAALLACGDAPQVGEDATGRESPSEREDGSLPLSASLSPDLAAPEVRSTDPDAPELVEARQLLEAYHSAITAGDYERAYSYWGDSGRASGRTFLEFVAEFAKTERSSVVVREGGRVEGAAGSRYLELPVVVTATADDGSRQRLQGSYTLRRVVVDGAPPDARRWHLHDAELIEVP